MARHGPRLAARRARVDGAEDEEVSANDSSLVPAHYASAYLHWDWVLRVRMGYLEACATKYVTRWREKDGIVGLRKALHYVNKVDENRAVVLCITNRVSYVAT